MAPDPIEQEVRGRPNEPRLLDLFCCEGGAAVGYHRAGFDVVGVDLFDKFSQRRYPFMSLKGDALDVLEEMLLEPGKWNIQAVHASPPCQHASAGTRAQDRSRYPALIEPVRTLLDAIGLPYVIENVQGADLIEPVTFCGTMFGLTATDDDGTPLEMWRHRLFETNFPIEAPGVCDHGRFAEQVAGSYGGARRDKHEARHVRHGGYVPSKQVQQQLLGIDWMTERGMHQALPPAYTEHIGTELMAHIEEVSCAA